MSGQRYGGGLASSAPGAPTVLVLAHFCIGDYTDGMTSAPRHFAASYAHSVQGWQVSVHKPALVARGRTLESARIAAVEAIAGHYGVATSLVMLDDDVTLDERVRDAVQAALESRDAVLAAQETNARLLRAAALALAEAGLSMRDSAYLLGLSHSRVQQLLGAARSSRGETS